MGRLLPALAVLGGTLAAELPQPSAHVEFAAFVETFGRTYEQGSAEYERRKALFQQRKEEVERHNAQQDRTWTAAVNSLADQTEDELRALRGYKRSEKVGQQPSSLLAEDVVVRSKGLEHLPTDFTWKPLLKAMQDVQDQSACGSCWAFASATVLRAHSELFQKDRKFSVQQIVSCTPNPNACGGTGGCDGATAELAMDYVNKHGCAMASEWPYSGTQGTCRTAKSSFLAVSPPGRSGGDLGAALGLTGYRKLPENSYEPLMLALYESGPVAVSVAAGAAWNMYSSGIMSACPKDAVIDHAVTLVGYGEEKGTKYWQIQNSWGPHWGEGGFVRLERLGAEEDRHCGWDTQPEIGSGCRGGPPKVWVCGSCGILYDTVVPSFQLSDSGLWVRSGRHFAPNSSTVALIGRSGNAGSD